MLSCKTGSDSLTSKISSEDNASHSQYGDQVELKLFLADFAGSVERGDWDRVLTFFDRDNYLEQLSIGVEKNQYIIEGMNLPVSEFASEGKSADLSLLRSLIVINISYVAVDRYAEVRGNAVLKNGLRIPFVLLIIRYENGEFAIAPPVG